MTYLQPVFPLVLLLALIQIISYRRSFKSPAFRGLALALVVVFLASWEPAAWLLSRCLGGRYPPREYPAGDAQAIVVLASAVYPPCSPMPTPRAGADTYERCQYAAWLFKHWKPLPILASGGGGGVDSPPYAFAMREALEPGTKIRYMSPSGWSGTGCMDGSRVTCPVRKSPTHNDAIDFKS